LQGYFDGITDEIIVSGIALAGGGARMPSGSCGAYAAGLMALSAALCPKADRLSVNEIEALKKIRSKFYKFRDWFASEFGGVNCAAVLLKLFGWTYHRNSDQEREDLRKLQKKLGFNCEVVTGKTVVELAKMLPESKRKKRG
jgi:hypothetical protein